MFLRKKTVLYFTPHQDDELLSMGIAIVSSIQKKQDVHVILCTDGSKSRVRTTMNNGKSCPRHPGLHTYDLSTEAFVQARDQEFIDSCIALGVKVPNIHIPENRSIDGSLSAKDAEAIIQRYLSEYGSNSVVCTISPNNGPSQHKDHKALGKAAENLLNRGILKEVRFFIEPYLFDSIKDNPRFIPVVPTIQKAPADFEAALRKAIDAYCCWNPEEHRYAVGYHSVTSDFDDFLNQLTAYFFDKPNLKTSSLLQNLRYQHQKWRKLQVQQQLFYALSDCPQPDLRGLRLICVPAQDAKSYRDFCEQHSVLLTEKNLQRIIDGFSFWCLVSKDGVVVSTGWLAFQRKFYIGETDFGFDMHNSDSAILFDFMTNPLYRGKGYYGLLLRSIVHQAKGPKRYLIYTSPDNTASSRGITKAGFQFEGVNSATDKSMQLYLQKEGFTSITRKYRLWGAWVIS